MTKINRVIHLLLLFSFCMCTEKPEQNVVEEKPPFNAPATEPLKIKKSNQEKIYLMDPYSEERERERMAALEYERKIIIPLITDILDHPVNCEAVHDDERAFNELKDIFRKEENPIDFLDVYIKDAAGSRISLRRTITLETEKKIQEQSEGHICFSFPNKTTITTLSDIWRKYPCTESSLVALLQISRILESGYIGYVPEKLGDEERYPPYRKEEIINFLDYILDNYPQCWETEYALRLKIIRTSEKNSKEIMVSEERWNEYVDTENIMDNKYYQFYYKVNKINMVWVDYGILIDIYDDRFMMLSSKERAENNRIPPEALEMYEKHYQLLRKINMKYPDDRSVNIFIDMHKRDDCHKLVEKYAPEHYMGDPTIPEAPKKNDGQEK